MLKNKLYKKYYPLKTEQELHKLLFEENNDFTFLCKTTNYKKRELKIRADVEMDRFYKRKCSKNPFRLRPLEDLYKEDEIKIIHDYLAYIDELSRKCLDKTLSVDEANELLRFIK